MFSANGDSEQIFGFVMGQFIVWNQYHLAEWSSVTMTNRPIDHQLVKFEMAHLCLWFYISIYFWVLVWKVANIHQLTPTGISEDGMWKMSCTLCLTSYQKILQRMSQNIARHVPGQELCHLLRNWMHSHSAFYLHPIQVDPILFIANSHTGRQESADFDQLQWFCLTFLPPHNSCLPIMGLARLW